MADALLPFRMVYHRHGPAGELIGTVEVDEETAAEFNAAAVRTLFRLHAPPREEAQAAPTPGARKGKG